MNDKRFELGKTYRVTFKDGRVLVVLFMGFEPPRFEVIKPEKCTLEGVDWLECHTSIEEVQESTDKEGGVK